MRTNLQKREAEIEEMAASLSRPAFVEYLRDIGLNTEELLQLLKRTDEKQRGIG